MAAGPTEHEVTRLLQAATEGDSDAFDQVFQIVYDELRQLAHGVRRGRSSATLNTTALVHEAYMRLLPSREYAWKGRSHFIGVAARAMRQVLVRAAERRNADKRGGGNVPVEFDESFQQPLGAELRGISPERVLALDAALTRLEQLDPRQARVVECRFFGGLSVQETAEALEISEPTVKRDWRAARAWLARELAD